jgi:hypothetical protein
MVVIGMGFLIVIMDDPLLLQPCFEILSPPECRVVACFSEFEIVTYGLLPDRAATSRRDAAPPQLARPRFPEDAVPVGEDVLVPDTEDGGLGAIAAFLFLVESLLPFPLCNMTR